jgi:hypothetical protein
MANVTTKALKPFVYEGKEYKEGDEVTIKTEHASRYARLDYIHLPKAEEKKAETAADKAAKK